MYLQATVLFAISVIFSHVAGAERAQRLRPRLCSNVTIPNAAVHLQKKNKLLRINCAQGFTLQGNNIIACENGKWNSIIPVCTKEGCKKPEDPANGFTLVIANVANIFCKDKFKLAGGRVSYCNGTSWDRPLGECRESTESIQLECDFETDDLCGWYHDETHNFDWKRIMAANVFQKPRTGPQHDHTTLTSDSGHFMLMESFDQPYGSAARLISPIYSKNFTMISGCFKFYYFMYGATVGNLNVYVKPLSVNIDELMQETRYLYFNLSGNQKNLWKEAFFTIEELTEDFQIVIEGTTGSNHLSDIAIDDTQLMRYFECNPESSSTTEEPVYTEYAIYDIQSCAGRCNENNSTGYGIKKEESKLFKICECHVECEELNTCCPNYEQICGFKNSETSKEYVATSTVDTRAIENSSILSTSENFSSLGSTIFATSIQKSTEQTKPTTEYTTTTIQTLTVKAKAIDYTPLLKTNIVPLENQDNERIKSTKLNTSKFILTTTELNMPTTSKFILTTTELNKPTTSKSKLTTENIAFNRKEKIVTWKVDHKPQGNNYHPKILICIVISLLPFTIMVLVLVIKFFRKIKMISLPYAFRYSNECNSDTTRLTYNQDDDTILED